MIDVSVDIFYCSIIVIGGLWRTKSNANNYVQIGNHFPTKSSDVSSDYLRSLKTSHLWTISSEIMEWGSKANVCALLPLLCKRNHKCNVREMKY